MIENFGLYLEQYGLPRILGRIYGLLMITDEPRLGLDQMAEQLSISKASASTSARQLQSFRMIEKVSIPGDRRDYYCVALDSHIKYLKLSLESALGMSKLCQEALKLEELSKDSRLKLERIEHLYDSIIKVIGEFWVNYEFKDSLLPKASKRKAKK